jgi:hypothetical protein
MGALTHANAWIKIIDQNYFHVGSSLDWTRSMRKSIKNLNILEGPCPLFHL